MLTEPEHALLLRRLQHQGRDLAELLSQLLAGGPADLSQLPPAEPGETPEEKLRRFLTLVDGRLKALLAGTYGTCETCHQPIPFAELDAVPWQTLCRRCTLGPA